MKLNSKGYMLVEIILASVIAMSIAYYLLNLTYKFKDKNEDVYYSTTMLSDKINITKSIMNDLEGCSISNIVKLEDNKGIKFEKNNKTMELLIEEHKITYGSLNDDNTFNTTDASYYTKTLDPYYEIGAIKIDNSSIIIPISNIYDDNNYDIILTIKQNSKFYLNKVTPGSYVAYTGNNGCSGELCNGQNAHYASDINMGYCKSSKYKFTVNGWRVGYISDGTAYLVSAGAPSCLCTNSDGTVDTSGSDCSSYEETNGAPLHIANLNNEALKYCNSNYAYGGVCNSSSAWAMKDDDFNQITGSTLLTCNDSSNTDCGLNNTLIDNGSYYWYATFYNSFSFYNVFNWAPNDRSVRRSNSNISYGLRPVLRLQSSVYVDGGSGTYDEPYQLAID